MKKEYLLSLIHILRDFEQRLQSQGFGLEQFKQVTGQTDEMIREEMGKDAFNKVKVRLVLEAIAAEEKIEISEEDVNNELENIAKDVYKRQKIQGFPFMLRKAFIYCNSISPSQEAFILLGKRSRL